VNIVEVRNFRIVAKYRIQRKEMIFRKDVRAIDERRALEKFYDILGSQNLKRTQIKIIEIKEIPPEDIKQRRLQKLALSEDPVLYVE